MLLGSIFTGGVRNRLRVFDSGGWLLDLLRIWSFLGTWRLVFRCAVDQVEDGGFLLQLASASVSDSSLADLA